MKSKAIIAVLAVALVAALVYATLQKEEIEKNILLVEECKVIVEKSRLEAENQKMRAEEASAIAEWRRHEAEAARMEAERRLQAMKK